MGARFAKWRAVLMDGEHSPDRCREVTEEVLRTVFTHLYTQGEMLEGMIVKPQHGASGFGVPQ